MSERERLQTTPSDYSLLHLLLHFLASSLGFAAAQRVDLRAFNTLPSSHRRVSPRSWRGENLPRVNWVAPPPRHAPTAVSHTKLAG